MTMVIVSLETAAASDDGDCDEWWCLISGHNKVHWQLLLVILVCGFTVIVVDIVTHFIIIIVIVVLMVVLLVLLQDV